MDKAEDADRLMMAAVRTSETSAYYMILQRGYTEGCSYFILAAVTT
jgi:hypothetical protein